MRFDDPTAPAKRAADVGHPAFIAVNSENGAMILTVSTIWPIVGHFSIKKGLSELFYAQKETVIDGLFYCIMQ